MIAGLNFVNTLAENINGSPISHKLLTVIILLILIIILTLPFYIYSAIHTKLFPRFGIYWDIKKNQYCPTCKKLLSDYNDENPVDPHFNCSHCKIKIHLHDELGREMPLKYATYFLYKFDKLTKKNIEKANKKIAKIIS